MRWNTLQLPGLEYDLFLRVDRIQVRVPPDVILLEFVRPDREIATRMEADRLAHAALPALRALAEVGRPPLFRMRQVSLN